MDIVRIVLSNMMNAYKKWFINSGWTQAFLLVLYLLTTFGVPLTHTCQLADKDVHHCYLECSDAILSEDSYAEENHIADLDQGNVFYSIDSDGPNCYACHFSLTTKVVKLYQHNSLGLTQTVASTQILPHLSFVMQLEWLSSAPLRAPPSMTS